MSGLTRFIFLEFWHVIPFTLITLYILYKKINPKTILLVFVFSFLIDLDHLFDLLKSKPENIFSIKNITGAYFTKNNKLYVPFHSFEIPAFLSLLSLFLKKHKKTLLIVSVTILGHIFIDLISYQPDFLTYSFIYRFLQDGNAYNQ
jgi:hypothetical protein